MKTHSLLHSVSILSLAALLTSQAFADPAPGVEPRRIYDLEKRQFVTNPDYREPSADRKSVAEPARIFDLTSQDFRGNPDYHGPAPVVTTNGRKKEPRRTFNLETGQFELNPAYRDSDIVARPPQGKDSPKVQLRTPGTSRRSAPMLLSNARRATR